MVDSTNLPDVDINQIATDLNNKMDRDCLNASDTGNIQMAHNAMPSSAYTQLTAGASDTVYTAPADGFVQWSVRPSAAGTLIGLSNITANMGSYLTCVNAGYLYSTYVPVAKGQQFSIYYSGALNENNLHFTYAQGSESEAS